MPSAARIRKRCVRRLSHCSPGAISRGRSCTRSCARRVLRLPPRRRWSPGSLRAVSSTTGVSRKTTSTGTRSADRARSASPPSSAGTGCRMPWWMRRSRAGRIGARSQAARGAPSSAGSPRRAGRTRRDRRVFCSIVAFRRIISARLRAPTWIRTETPLNKPSYMSAAQVRSAFLDFFRARGHVIVPSSSLVPGNDPTLLFTNAGMVQFKDVFLGRERRDYLRATSSQRCVRAGGKHNDLENVGYTARHHTFFEMLGNFSFGDYFKREAIHFAWDFLTRTLGLDPARLWCTVYSDDDDAADIWLKDVGVSPQRFARLGEASNFWAMGDTGPCGPCSEIFYDHGARIPGGPPGSAGEEGDRFVEIWNLVFMQFERSADGKLTPLPKPSVDTGMGLERIAAVMQGVHSNYDIDLFKNLIGEAGRLAGTSVLTSSSLRVIADHIRASAFLVVDGVLPTNEGRGYVLRRIMRRAIRHGYKLGMQQPFFHKLVPVLAEQMGEAYPELVRGSDHAQRVLRTEEERFAETLANGMVVLDQTPFYAEAGGQVGDAGELTGPGVRFVVEDTQKDGAAHVHVGRLEQGGIRVGDTLTARVDGARRQATALNHSATHLLHAALRKVLGKHVQQKGSLVAPDRLRFDFSHFQPVTPEELHEIERLVNAQIRANIPAETRVMDYEGAVAGGAIALFGEKYDKDVRVLRLGEFSMELCGGTHVQRAGDIGLFKIVSESGVASGVRRIEALTGEGALDYVEQNEALLKEVAALVRGTPEELKDKVREQLERTRQLEREIRSLRDRLASGHGVSLAAGAVDVQGVKVVATKVDGADAGALRQAVDQLEERPKYHGDGMYHHHTRASD